MYTLHSVGTKDTFVRHWRTFKSLQELEDYVTEVFPGWKYLEVVIERKD